LQASAEEVQNDVLLLRRAVVVFNLREWLRRRRSRGWERNLDQYVAYAHWNEDNSRVLNATCDCGNMPIMGDGHAKRWTPGSRAEQYRKLNEIVEAAASPLKRQLDAQGFCEDFMRVSLRFEVKRTPDDEPFDIEAGIAAIDYDPLEARRAADEYNSVPRGSDRLLSWDYVYTVDGRVQGHFDADESRRVGDAWKKKHGDWAPRSEWLYLRALTVKIVAFPGQPIYGGPKGRHQRTGTVPH
jgi:hypothetical protein